MKEIVIPVNGTHYENGFTFSSTFRKTRVFSTSEEIQQIKVSFIPHQKGQKETIDKIYMQKKIETPPPSVFANQPTFGSGNSNTLLFNEQNKVQENKKEEPKIELFLGNASNKSGFQLKKNFQSKQ